MHVALDPRARFWCRCWVSDSPVWRPSRHDGIHLIKRAIIARALRSNVNIETIDRPRQATLYALEEHSRKRSFFLDTRHSYAATHPLQHLVLTASPNTRYDKFIRRLTKPASARRKHAMIVTEPDPSLDGVIRMRGYTRAGRRRPGEGG